MNSESDSGGGLPTPTFAGLVSHCTNSASCIKGYTGALREHIYRGGEMQGRIYVHLAAVGRPFLDYAILSLVMRSPRVEHFESHFESYLRSEGFLLCNWWVDPAGFTPEALTSRLVAMENEGVIRRGTIDMPSISDSAVLVFCEELTPGSEPRYLLTEYGASLWLHFEESVLDGQYSVSGWSPHGSVSVSKRPLALCPFEGMGIAASECSLYCEQCNGQSYCQIGFIPKWKAAWWRPITPGYAVICCRDDILEVSKLFGSEMLD